MTGTNTPSNVLELYPSEAYDFIMKCIISRQVPYIAGPPAIGKSQVAHQVAKDCNLLLIDVRLSQMLSEDMNGIPERDTKTGKAIYLPFDTFPLEGDEVPAGYDGWMLLLDELSSAAEEVMAASYSILLDRTLGGKKLHPRCVVMAAGNRATDSAIARALPDTLITRMVPAEMKVSAKDWRKWARKNPHANEAVMSFIDNNPSMLYAPTKASERSELETYATPRGWEKVMTFMNAFEKATKEEDEVDAAGVPTGNKKNGKALDDITFKLVAACVGTLAARAFKDDYDASMSLPFPWEVAQSPASCRVPNNNQGKAKLTTDLVQHFTTSDNQTRDAILQYMNRIGGEYNELFCDELKNKLGQNRSDLDLLEDVKDRLKVAPF